jgi:hypothetical protein
MNWEIGTKAAQLLFWEYLNLNFFAARPHMPPSRRSTMAPTDCQSERPALLQPADRQQGGEHLNLPPQALHQYCIHFYTASAATRVRKEFCTVTVILPEKHYYLQLVTVIQ